jgi:hypothetical protein
MSTNRIHQYGVVGWREWVFFPDFSNARVKAKVDTGARTSAIHAYEIKLIERGEPPLVSFIIHPNQKDNDTIVQCQAPLVERRVITDSGGHQEERFVVSVQLKLGAHRWPVELSLTDRDSMGFRMLLGRTALKQRFLVQPWRSYLEGKPISNDSQV